MKILIISDTHGAHRNFDRVIEKEQTLDMLIHLGDVEGDARLYSGSCGLPGTYGAWK